MTKLEKLLVSYCVVFTLIGLVLSIILIINSKNWILLSWLTTLLIVTYLWISEVTENSNLRAKIKELENKLHLLSS